MKIYCLLAHGQIRAKTHNFYIAHKWLESCKKVYAELFPRLNIKIIEIDA